MSLFLIIWVALAIAFAGGYILRGLMDKASRRTNVYPPRRIEGYRSHAWSSAFGDIDDRLKDYADEYRGRRVPPICYEWESKPKPGGLTKW